MLRVTREVCCASTDPHELIAMLHELRTRGVLELRLVHHTGA